MNQTKWKAEFLTETGKMEEPGTDKLNSTISSLQPQPPVRTHLLLSLALCSTSRGHTENLDGVSGQE